MTHAERQRKYRDTHPIQWATTYARQLLKNKDRRQHDMDYRRHLAAQRAKWRAKNRELYLSIDRAAKYRSRQRLQLETLTHYGQGMAQCVICGYADCRALTIDHLQDNGAEERRALRGKNFYATLKNLGFPSGYQTLCWNCQWIKEIDRRQQNRQKNLMLLRRRS